MIIRITSMTMTAMVMSIERGAPGTLPGAAAPWSAAWFAPAAV